MHVASDIDTPEQDAARLAWAGAELFRRQAEALAKCTMLPGSYDKRFARDMAAIAKAGGGDRLTDRQRHNLIRMLWRYRRQIPRTLVPDINPDDPMSPHFQGFRTVLLKAPPERGLIHG